MNTVFIVFVPFYVLTRLYLIFLQCIFVNLQIKNNLTELKLLIFINKNQVILINDIQ